MGPGCDSHWGGQGSGEPVCSASSLALLRRPWNSSSDPAPDGPREELGEH